MDSSDGLSAEELWLLGLLWADAGMNGRSVAMSQVDEEVTAEAARIAGIRYRRNDPPPHRSGPYQGRPRGRIHRLYFPAGHEVVPVLARHGFGPKAQRLWPLGLASPAFLRGLFDGDGSVVRQSFKPSPRLYLKTKLYGPCGELEGVRSWLACRGLQPNKITDRVGSPGSGMLQWGHHDSLRLADLMYSAPGPCMARKRAVFVAGGYSG